MRQGIDPMSGERLRKDRENRVYQKPWGEKIHKAREFYEVVISAPKSVSLQGLIDPQVVAAHELAVNRIVSDLEHMHQGELVMGVWQHRASRAGDPQLHTHIAVMNVAHDEMGWHCLHAKPLFDNQKVMTAEYRATLLGEVEKMGYRVAYPEISGIDEAFREKYSQRAHQIDHAIDEFHRIKGEWPDGNQMQTMIYQTRPPKDARTAREIMEEQFTRLEPQERVQLLTLAGEANERQRLYVAPSISQLYGGVPRRPRPEVKESRKHPQLVIEDWGPATGAGEKPKWTYGESPKQGLGM
jgi:conjugative relaxase-like TrwC/TraI family protein